MYHIVYRYNNIKCYYPKSEWDVLSEIEKINVNNMCNNIKAKLVII